MLIMRAVIKLCPHNYCTDGRYSYDGAGIGIYFIIGSRYIIPLAGHPNSSTAAVRNLTRTTNVGNPGVWVFQVSPSGILVASYPGSNFPWWAGKRAWYPLHQKIRNLPESTLLCHTFNKMLTHHICDHWLSALFSSHFRTQWCRVYTI